MEGAANPADHHSLSTTEFVSNLMGAVQPFLCKLTPNERKSLYHLTVSRQLFGSH